MLDTVGIQSNFANNTPSSAWVYTFLKRFPELKLRVPESLGKDRARVEKEDILKWFDTFTHWMKTEIEDPVTFFANPVNWTRIFNLDETGFHSLNVVKEPS